MAEPSKVIHIRNVGHEISENDLLQLFQPFGVITKLVVLRPKNQALLQMQDIPSAVSAIQYYANSQPNIRGRNVYVQFSSHRELTTMDQQSQGREDERLSVFPPVFPYLDMGSNECVQALIQYGTYQSAVTARGALQGRNVYDGCCQMDIQFSNLNELQVNYNNDRSRDFTNPFLPTEQKGRPSQSGHGDAEMYGVQRSGSRQGGSSQRIDEDKLFNLFSIYGNIMRIIIFRNKPHSALVQMGDGFQAELAVHFLKGAMLFGKQLDVNYSMYLNIPQGAHTREYVNSNLNRFNRNAAKNYRYCCSPTRIIHVSSLPQDITEDELVSVLVEHGIILNCKVFEINGKKQALVQFQSEEQATEALVCKHAISLAGSVIRISFSQLQYI
ncbi:hypothetical protein TSUD_288190 [Trifolium subterraneum]|uniref:RRM domain-containing protein n=1 Tax=Trifolium subterraneum TaxID=3900 RepID=A0A2Z6PAB9_TRISU|nr:hypothetical protein TSUD_288190 [Trifolium subterraneum]